MKKQAEIILQALIDRGDVKFPSGTSVITGTIKEGFGIEGLMTPGEVKSAVIHGVKRGDTFHFTNALVRPATASTMADLVYTKRDVEFKVAIDRSTGKPNVSLFADSLGL